MALHTKPNGKTFKRVSFPGTQRGNNYCARSLGKKEQQKSEQEDIFGDVEEKKAIQ